MLQLLIHILIISAICLVWGLPVYVFNKNKNTCSAGFKHALETLTYLFFTGLIILSIFSSWLVLFTPLRFNTLLILTIVLGLFIFITRQKKISELILNRGENTISFTFTTVLFLICSILLFIVLGAAKPVNIDTGIYHLQIIRWTNEYGSVPGIANLYPRLGLGSSWFNLISFFNITAFKDQNFTYLNATTVIWFFIFLLYKFLWQFKSRDGNKTLALLYFFLLAYCFFDWQLFRNTANSTSYDFIVSALYMFCIIFLIEKKLNKEPVSLPAIVFIVSSLSIITFKLSGIFIFPLLIYFLFIQHKRNYWWQSIAAGIIILLPLCIKNYIITGYPLYPLSFSPTNPDWQLPSDMVIKMNDYIVNSNRYYNYPASFSDTMEKSLFKWIPFWIIGIPMPQKILIATSIVSGIFFLTGFKISNSWKQLRPLVLLLLLITITWFFIAPDPRFGYGFLLILVFLPLSVFMAQWMSAKNYRILFLLMAGTFSFYLIKKSGFLVTDKSHFIHVQATEKPPYTLYRQNGIEFYFTEKINSNWNNRCFYTTLPCLCERNPFIKARGKNLKDGFKMNPKPDSSFINNYNY